MSNRLAFYFDSSACIGCKACELACKDKNNLLLGVRFRRVWDYGGGGWAPDPQQPSVLIPSNVFVYSLSISCMHCEKAPCVDVCPTGAMTKREDGIVYANSDKCIGCRYCEWACPYGAPQYDDLQGVVRKCDLCVDLIESGEDPACVAICPQRALEYGEYDDLVAKYGNIGSVKPLPSTELTNPSFIIKPHKHAQDEGQDSGQLLFVA